MYNPKILADRLLLSRRDLGWRQEDLAAKSGVSRTYISEIERGRVSNVGVEPVFALAAALDVPVAFLLGISDASTLETEDPATVSGNRVFYDLQNPEDRLFFQELLNVAARLEPDQRRQLLALARSWADGRTVEAAYLAAITSLAGPDFADRLTGLLDAGATMQDVQVLLDELRQDKAQQRKSRK